MFKKLRLMLYTKKAIALAFFLYQLPNDLANLELFLFFLFEVVLVFFKEDAKVLRFKLLDLVVGSNFFSSVLTIFYQFFNLNSDFITILYS